MDNPDIELTEIAKRACDLIGIHIAVNDWDDIKNSFVAIRLSDGGGDNVLYDSKREAVRHQLYHEQCAYFCFRNVGPGGPTVRDMKIFLDMNRKAYKAGMRLTDPDDQFGGRELVPTTGRVDYNRRLAALGLVLPR